LLPGARCGNGQKQGNGRNGQMFHLELILTVQVDGFL
jgi:hypothetical protein